jgi:hypothetical protein
MRPNSINENPRLRSPVSQSWNTKPQLSFNQSQGAKIGRLTKQALESTRLGSSLVLILNCATQANVLTSLSISFYNMKIETDLSNLLGVTHIQCLTECMHIRKVTLLLTFVIKPLSGSLPSTLYNPTLVPSETQGLHRDLLEISLVHKAVSCGDQPGGRDEGSATQVTLAQGVEAHLPRPLALVSISATNDPSLLGE